MTFEEIKDKLAQYKAEGKLVFASSSFQTQSIPLLHILSRIDKELPIYMINTGYLFPETLKFKDQLVDMLGIKVIELHPAMPKHLQKDKKGRLLFTSDPDFCCHVNKVLPLEPILIEKDIWISGVRADQTSVRKAMQTEQEGPHGVLRFHPMLDWTNKMVYDYIREFNLPKHPMEELGYMSVGCEPCTMKLDLDLMSDPRYARWFGSNKNECGLHTELAEKSD